MNIGIPQGLLISLIFILFYNTNLFNIYNQPERALSAGGFVNDINIFTYGNNTKKIATDCKEFILNIKNKHASMTQNSH